MKNLIRKLLPKSLILFYHKTLAIIANFYYGRPSEKLVIIGVTGTKGKSTTGRLITEILKAAGKKVGLTSTVEFEIAGRQWLNDKKMTMLGRWELQKLLNLMVKAGCQYAIIETSSEGIKQFRHFGINYDLAVFTNLTPEHIEAHGSFENYKKAKGELFTHLTAKHQKKINGKTIPKISVVNLDDENASYFLQFATEQKWGYTLKTHYDISGVQEVRATAVELTGHGSTFQLKAGKFYTPLLGEFNVYNCLAAATVGLALGITEDKIKAGITTVQGVPGRLEFIKEGQLFTVMVDQAPEPASLSKVYETIKLIIHNKTIHVLGSCGGGRDKVRRPILGGIAAKHADYVIITNEDPYDDDPQEIINQVAEGAIKAGKTENQNLFKILDRREAIGKALALANSGDLVLVTGKGAEQAICVADGKKIPWDDRRVVREELKKMNN